MNMKKYKYTTKVIKIIDSTEEEKQQFSKQTGDIVRMTIEGYGIWDIAEKLNMTQKEITERIYLLLHLCRRHVGKRNYILETFKH